MTRNTRMRAWRSLAIAGSLLVAITAGAGDGDVRALEWDALIPDGYRPDELMEKYDAGNLDDGDPRAAQLLAEMRALWDASPVVEALDGQRVSLTGFVVPLEGDGETYTRFLLVPYYGACIHVPPPPANQTVLVQAPPGGARFREVFDVVTVTGVLSVGRAVSDYGVTGYAIAAAQVTPFDFDEPP